jgi:hypothetical protein
LAIVGSIVAGCSPPDDPETVQWDDPGFGHETPDDSSRVAPLPRCPAYRSHPFSIVAIDDETDEIVRFDPRGGEPAEVLARPVADVDESERLDTPFDLAVSLSGDVFVANFGTGSVNRYDARGRFVEVVYFDRRVLEEPTALHLAEGALWVLGNDTKNLVAIDPNGAGMLAMVGGDSSIPWPLALAIDSTGSRAFITATAAPEGERVQVWDLESGRRVDAFGGSELGEVLGVELGCRGAAYVSTTDAVIRYRPRALVDGVPMGPFEAERTFELPGARRLRVGPDGHIYAAAQAGLVRLNADATAFEPVEASAGMSLRAFAFSTD